LAASSGSVRSTPSREPAAWPRASAREFQSSAISAGGSTALISSEMVCRFYDSDVASDSEIDEVMRSLTCDASVQNSESASGAALEDSAAVELVAAGEELDAAASSDPPPLQAVRSRTAAVADRPRVIRLERMRLRLAAPGGPCGAG
jgi:hypothetical protein